MTDNLSNNSPMLSNSLSDNEIIKALECCVFAQSCAFDEDKFYCHHGYSKFCDKALLDDALDLITRQKAEIKDLQDLMVKYNGDFAKQEAEIERLQKAIAVIDIMEDQHAYSLQKAKAEAYKECLGKVKSEIDRKLQNEWTFSTEGKTILYSLKHFIDNLLKEMVGGKP